MSKFRGKKVSIQEVNYKKVSTSITCDGATETWTNAIPAGATVLGVNCAVTTAVEGASAFTVGDGTDADRWGTGIAIAAGTLTTSADYTAGGPVFYGSATSIVLTATTSDFTAGVVKVDLYYFDVA